MMLNVHKNHKGRGEGGRGVEMGEREITDIYRNTVTTRMAPALRWAAMSHFNVSFIHCEGQCHKPDSAHGPQLLKRKESRSGFEPRSLCLPTCGLTARPNRLTSLAKCFPSLYRMLQTPNTGFTTSVLQRKEQEV